MALAELATPARVGNLLAQTVTGMETVYEDSLAQACADADAIVLDHLMRADIDDLAEEVQAAVLFVATKVAARIYRNPRELSNYNFGDVSQTFVDPRILTGDEKAQLKRARSAKVVRGPIIISGAASVI
jgi:hypothetical protein